MVPVRKRQDLIRQFHDSLFAGHLGITQTVFRLLDRVYWPGLRGDVQTYIKSCTICIARKSPCPRRAPMGHVEVGHRWERVAMDLLNMSVTTARGNRYVLVMVDCFSRWTEACPLPDKTAHSVADAFFNQVVCRFILIKDGNLRIKSCRNCVYCVDHIRQEQHRTTRRVMGWLNVLIGHYL